MKYTEQLFNIKRDIIRSLRELVDKEKNVKIQSKELDTNFVELGLDWTNNLVLIDDGGYTYSVMSIDMELLAEIADSVLS